MKLHALGADGKDRSLGFASHVGITSIRARVVSHAKDNRDALHVCVGLEKFIHKIVPNAGSRIVIPANASLMLNRQMTPAIYKTFPANDSSMKRQ